MTEANQDSLNINTNPNPENNTITLNINSKPNPEATEYKKEKENQNQEKNGAVSVEIHNLEMNTTERINVTQKNPINIQLELNSKDIIQLPQEIKDKLNITPCPLCQSDIYRLYIPDSSSFPQPEIPPNNLDGESRVNPEITEAKFEPKNCVYFPILICQQNHQRCLMCNQNPHINNLCEEQFLNYSKIIPLYDLIKEIIPEEKKNDFNSLYNFASNKIQQNQYSGESCCNWNCTWSISLFIFLLFLWTAVSAGLLGVGLGFLFLSIALRVLCCVYHCVYAICCTTTVTEEDKGNYILRTTTHHVDREIANEIEGERHDNDLSECGAGSMLYVILIIPEGYKKICGWFEEWKN